MKANIIICIVSYFILISIQPVNARIGLAETSFNTPGGYTICDCDVLQDYDKNAPTVIGYEWQIPRLKKWYFYKKHIIGVSEKNYFVLDEANNRLDIYQTEAEWQNAINERGLNPAFWTIWLDMGDAPENWFFILIMSVLTPVGWLFWLSVIFFYGIFGYQSIIKERLRLNSIYTKVFLTALVTSITMYFYLTQIQSI
jgi:hypothetical protein